MLLHAGARARARARVSEGINEVEGKREVRLSVRVRLCVA